MFEALSASALLIGRPVVDVGARTEAIGLGAKQDMIFLGFKYLDGQRASNGQRLFQLGGDRGAGRDTERHYAPARLQVEGKFFGFAKCNQCLIHGDLVGIRSRAWSLA